MDVRANKLILDKEKSQTPRGLAFEWLIQISFCLRL